MEVCPSTGKWGYATKREASAALRGSTRRRRGKRGRLRVHKVYQCPSCGNWHLSQSMRRREF